MKTNNPRIKLILTCLLGGLMVVIPLLRLVPIPGLESLWLQKQLAEERRTSRIELEHRAHEEREKRGKAAQDKISLLLADGYARMHETINSSRTKADGVISKHRDELPNLTAKVDEQLQGYGNALAIVAMMAQDRVRGTKTTQVYLQGAFQPVVKSRAQAEVALRDILEHCVYDLKSQSAQLLAATANVLKTADFESKDLGLAESLNKFAAENLVRAIDASKHAATATIGVAVEAILIRTTFESLTKLLASAVGKEATSIGIGIGGAPIPGVDIATSIIALAGSAWTAYDVFAAVNELQKVHSVIENGLNDTVNKLESNTNDQFVNFEKTVSSLCNKK